MFNIKRIRDIMIDYRSGTMVINGNKVDFPFKVVVKEADGWDISKLFNPEAVNHCGTVQYPELVIDATELQEMVTQQELKKIVKEAIEEIPRQKSEN